MAQIIKEITVDVAKKNLFPAIVAKQNDSNSRFLKVTLTNEGKKITIAPGSDVIINAKRADRTSKPFRGEVNGDGTATVPLTAWMLELDDTVICDISIIDAESRRLTSTSFQIDTEAAACLDEDVVEEDNPGVLVELLEGLRILNNTRVWKKEISNKGVVTIFAESGSPLEISCKVVTQEIPPESGDKSADNPSTFLGLNSITVTVGDKNYTFSLPSTAWGLPGFEDIIDLNSGQLIHSTGHIPGYNGEEIGDVYLSSTGGLDIGAEVVYPLAEPIAEPITGIEKIYSVVHTDKYIPEPTAVTCECAELVVGYAANLNAAIGNSSGSYIVNHSLTPVAHMDSEVLQNLESKNFIFELDTLTEKEDVL